MKYTVTQTANKAGIAPTTVRAWVKELAPVLSDGANPKPGIERKFTDDDVIVLHTAKVLRAEKIQWDNIIASIEAGETILPPPDDDQTDKNAPESGESTAMVAKDQWELFTQPYRDLIASLEDRQQRLETELSESNAARLKAEIEAAELRGRLDRRPWYRRLFGGGDG